MTIFMYILSLSYSLLQIQPYCAKTTIRLWHQIFAERKMSHDFQDLLAPNIQGDFIALLQHDEIKAIGQLRKNSLEKVAYCPDQSWAASVLIQQILQTSDLCIDYKSLRSQTRWYYESIYEMD